MTDTTFGVSPKKSERSDGFVIDQSPGASTPILWDKVEALEKQVKMLTIQLADLARFIDRTN